MPATATLTLPRRTSRPAALDHEALFATGLERIRLLASGTWTDHNVHDPGITTLELLSYALTDLGYRASYPVADLLASESGNAERMAERFFTARQLLHAAPLTAADYRRLLIDLPGVKNAWIHPVERVYGADMIRGELLPAYTAGVPGQVPVHLRGLYGVRVELMENVTTAGARQAVLDAVRARLAARRNLCEEFVEVQVVQEQDFRLCGELELAPDADVDEVQAQVLFAVQEYLSPPVRQRSLDEMRSRTGAGGELLTTEEIFDGPALEHGFIDAAELAAAELRTEIRLSDVVSRVMDVPGVRAVRDLVVQPAPPAAPPPTPWLVPVAAGRKPRLDPAGSRLVMYKRNLPFSARAARVAARLQELAAAARAFDTAPAVNDFPIPLGTFRDPADYPSFQNHFPAVYGVGEDGPPAGADARRGALALQLSGYLLFFDQVMADFCAQLARAGDLLSPDPLLEQTYFHQTVDSFRSWQSVYAVADPGAALDAADDRELSLARRNRFLDHLLARYAERLHEYVQVMHDEFGADPAAMIRYKGAFLRDYPAIGADRGMAYDATRQDDAGLWNSGNVSGLERRLARLLGIRRGERRNLGDVAWDVYAEVDATPGDEFRWRVRHKATGKILLSGTTIHATQAGAREEMRRALRFASLPSGYRRRVAVDGRHYFLVVDDQGDIIAQRKAYFATAAALEAEIAALMEYVQTEYGDEGMFVIESLLLRPEQPGDPMLPICPEPDCVECAEADPYSYRIHVVLPAFAGRFADMRFRRWAEEVVREEVPAHIQPRVCWVGRDDMAALEKRYRDWIYLRSGRETADRAQKLRDFVDALFASKNVYPPQALHDCSAPEGTDKFVLGQTALGSES